VHPDPRSSRELPILPAAPACYEPHGPREECGVIGIWAPGHPVARLTYLGLHALQHRGQESAGIATTDGNGLHLHKRLGLVSQVFDRETIEALEQGRDRGGEPVAVAAIGHTRYSTTGSNTLPNVQPVHAHGDLGELMLGHNGNLTNATWLRDELSEGRTVIVGFPGETDEDFEAMLALLEELRFDHLGAFSYSAEEGTAAAGMAGQVPEALRRERLERVLELQRAIALEKNEARIGGETTVLVERSGRRGELVGRTPWQAPELDGIVSVRGGTAPAARPGDFVRARIIEVAGRSEDDLVARIIQD